MVLFFDTTVLVASSSQAHPHFAQASAAVTRVATGKDQGFLCQHSIAEMYAALTRMPVSPRIHPLEAARIIGQNVLQYFQIVPLVKDDYQEALTLVANAGWVGAKIYDALMLLAADKCPA